METVPTNILLLYNWYIWYRLLLDLVIMYTYILGLVK